MRLSAALGIAVLLSSAAAVAEPALWVVKGPHATVYLFGSVHVLAKDLEWRSPQIDAAINNSQELWLEIADANDAKAPTPILMELGMDSAHPLSTRLSKDQVARLDTAAKAAGIPGGEGSLEPMRPWMAALSLSVFPLLQAGYDPASGVEMKLKPEFVGKGKPVKGFETAAQQFHYFADLPQKTEVEYLDTTVKEFDGGVDKFKKIVAAWYAGDEDALDGLFDNEWRTEFPDLYQTLVVKRNHAFADQIDKLLKGDTTAKGDRSSFVAVGAGHLVGPDGVPALLTKLGYSVQRQ
jgi:uncharacterized protein YbaP (TraB family)